MKPRSIYLALVCALFLISLLALGKNSDWDNKMLTLARTFRAILPETVKSGPLTPTERVQLEKNVQTLLSLAHDLKQPETQNSLKEQDPTLTFVSHLFERQLREAALSIHTGHEEYARRLLRTSTGYCIACHTRSNLGPSFPREKLAPVLESLPPLEKADLLAATRQFDGAFVEYEKIALDPSFLEQKTISWEKAVQSALAVSVRVKNDPDKTLGLVDRVLKLSAIPPSYRNEVMAWKSALEEWKAEKAQPLTTEESLFQEAKRLADLGRSKQQYPLDHSAEVWYLRASSVAHQLLSKYPKGKTTGQTLLLQGTLYDLLGERVLSSLPELYYEACIQQAPHSEVAGQCYQQYEDDIYFGYSGSGGTNIPAEIKSRLKQLSLLASP